MSDSTRTLKDASRVMNARRACAPDELITFFDNWAGNYEKDVNLLDYRGPNLVADFISSNFSGCREEAQVLDVACGPGQLAKLMSEHGFRHFVGIDSSKNMLQEAAKTGFYEDLILATLGTEPLPAQAGTFDVVATVGALQPEVVPFSVLRELCHVTKPGGLICLTESHKTEFETITLALERELQLLEAEGLWTPVGIKKTDKFLKDSHMIDREDAQNDSYMTGTVYLFRTPLM